MPLNKTVANVKKKFHILFRYLRTAFLVYWDNTVAVVIGLTLQFDVVVVVILSAFEPLVPVLTGTEKLFYSNKT